MFKYLEPIVWKHWN